jgi:RNA polymerase sigma factor (sigma-70 family)
MSCRVSESALHFDRFFINSLLQVPVSNRARLAVVSRALREAIDTELTPRQREVLHLYYYENQRCKDIAETLGVHPSTICRIRQRAEQRLRRSLRFYMEYLNCTLEDD